MEERGRGQLIELPVPVAQERGADTAALVVGMNGKERQVPVRIVGVVFVHRSVEAFEPVHVRPGDLRQVPLVGPGWLES